MKDFDYIIIGGGCAGLSLAYELEIKKKLKNKTLAIIDNRTNYNRDKTWSFWKVNPHNFDDCVIKNWKDFSINIPNKTNYVSCARTPYQSINSGLFYKKIFNRLEKNQNIKFLKTINDINVRASYVLSYLFLPYFHDGGHIIMHSPSFKFIKESSTYKNKAAYMISKYGMTMTSMGIAEEFKGRGIASNTIWPSTPIQSFATKNNNLGTEKHWRKPDIIADAILEIINEDPNQFTGNQLIDEDYLMSKGITDFTKYRCIKEHEPPKLNDFFKYGWLM